MKNIILNITLLCSLSLSVYSQSICDPYANPNSYYDAGPNVFTCSGGSIATIVANCEWSNSQIATLKSGLLSVYGKPVYGANGIEEADLLALASVEYNCHAYAWHLTEGNANKVWINNIDNGNSNLSKYWSGDYACFEEVFSESQAEKIHYYSGDHSAVKSSVVGKYESKWGKNFLVRHHPTTCPSDYQSAYRKYYKKKPTIIGPSSVCPGSTETFTAHNFSGTVTWTCSSNLKITSTNGNMATVKSNSRGGLLSPPTSDGQNDLSLESTDNSSRAYKPINPDPTGWIKASDAITGKSVQVFVIASTVWLSDMATTINYTGSGNTLFTICMPPSLPDISWEVLPSWIGVWYYGDNLSYTFEFDKNMVGIRTIKATATNECGSTVSTFLVDVSGRGGGVSVYPNPSSDILTIEINADFTQEAVDSQESSNTPFTFDIRLYDGQGNMLRQQSTKGDTVQFNVSNLPNGIYYLHIYDGVNSTLEMQQIVIEH